MNNSIKRGVCFGSSSKWVQLTFFYRSWPRCSHKHTNGKNWSFRNKLILFHDILHITAWINNVFGANIDTLWGIPTAKFGACPTPYGKLSKFLNWDRKMKIMHKSIKSSMTSPRTYQTHPCFSTSTTLDSSVSLPPSSRILGYSPIASSLEMSIVVLPILSTLQPLSDCDVH